MMSNTNLSKPGKRVDRRELMIASVMIVAGVAMTAVSLLQLAPTHAHAQAQMAQATPPLQSTPGAANKPTAPSEPATTGQRPHDTPPQPARPDADAQDAGAKPALPAAPAEEVAPPITAK